MARSFGGRKPGEEMVREHKSSELPGFDVGGTQNIQGLRSRTQARGCGGWGLISDPPLCQLCLVKDRRPWGSVHLRPSDEGGGVEVGQSSLTETVFTD